MKLPSIVVFVVFLASACMDSGPLLVLDEESVFDESEAQSIMRDLAASISIIEDVSIMNVSILVQRQTVLNELEKIEELGDQLQQDDLLYQSLNRHESHTTIKGYLENMSDEVSRAIDEISQPSPDFYIAGRLAGACVACHEDLWGSL